MAKSYESLRKKMTPASRARAEKMTRQHLAEMPIHELRRAMQLSQEQLAYKLGTKQANVSKVERRTDMYISTLRSYIKAVGGELQIIAHFPDGDVMINQFGEV